MYCKNRLQGIQVDLTYGEHKVRQLYGKLKNITKENQ
jgi:hypothetical protein